MIKKNNRGDFNIWTCELYSKQDNEHPSPLSRYDFSLQRLLHPYTYTHVHMKVCMSFFMKVSANVNIWMKDHKRWKIHSLPKLGFRLSLGYVTQELPISLKIN